LKTGCDNRPRNVVFSADDFGLSEAVNEAVEEAHRRGVLRRASLMVAGPAAADAVQRARRNPGLQVGLHMVLVDGASVLGRAGLPDLVDEAGRFGRDQVRRGFRYFFHPRVRQQLRAEITAQFAAFAATGLPLSHADGHKHMHLHPTIGTLLIEIGRGFGLRRLRVPSEPAGPLIACGTRVSLGHRAVSAWSGVLRTQARRAGLLSEDQVFGLVWSGQMTPARIRTLIPHLPPGSSEIYFHPAARRDPDLAALMPDYDHIGEYQALLDAELPGILARHGVLIGPD
jgi:hopanoid biosynthesis associated protein HpnK